MQADAFCATREQHLKLELVQRISKKYLMTEGDGESRFSIRGMCYNSARDELFFANYEEVRVMRLRKESVRTVFNAGSSEVVVVCYFSHLDTLVVCSMDGLIALTRRADGWRQAQRMKFQTIENMWSLTCCELSNSRVLIGSEFWTDLELFSIDSSPRIVRGNRFHVPETFFSLSATCRANETLVAMTHINSVSVHRLCDAGDVLEKLARISLEESSSARIIWLVDRLFVTNFHSATRSEAVFELELVGTRLKRGAELISPSARVIVWSWCATGNGLGIYDNNADEFLRYELA